MGTSGSVSFMFDHKCHFKIDKGELDVEELELEMIDFGVDEVFEDENSIMLYGEFSDYGTIQKAIEDMGYEIKASGFERIPQTTTSLSEEQVADVEKLLERIEEDEDVQNVYHNMEA